MTKLRWDRAKAPQSDPARVQQVNDFLIPDPTVVSVTKVEHSEAYKFESLLQRVNAQVRTYKKDRQAAEKAAREAARAKFFKR